MAIALNLESIYPLTRWPDIAGPGLACVGLSFSSFSAFSSLYFLSAITYLATRFIVTTLVITDFKSEVVISSFFDRKPDIGLEPLAVTQG